MDNIDELYRENEKLIHVVIKRHFPQFINSAEYDDAFQEGSIGLMKALKNFNPELGYKISSYAYPAIKSAIYKAMYKRESGMKVSRTSHEKYIEYKKLLAEGYTFNEIVDILNTSYEFLFCAVNAYNGDYLNRTIFEGEDGRLISLGDTIISEKDFTEEIENKMELRITNTLCKSFLTDTDIEIITNYYNNTKQLEIGEKVGLSQASISRRMKKIEGKVFPLFKKYLLDELKYGSLCIELLKYERDNAKYCIRGYSDYIFELIARDKCNDNFLDEMNQVLSSMSIKALQNLVNFLFDNSIPSNATIKSNLNSIFNVVDKYYSTNGIEEVVYDISSVMQNRENMSHINNFRLQLNTI